jgi:NADH-quinone oxidoreductase subunit D
VLSVERLLGIEKIREFLRKAPSWVHDLRTLIDANPVFRARTRGIAFMDLEACMALGVTGPMLRAAGLPWDLRKSQPYLGYETFDFDVPTETTCDTYGRYLVRIREIEESLKLVEQVLDRLADRSHIVDDPWMIADAKIGWPARLSLGPDGMGPSPEHIAHIMGQSMEGLIHHFKLVTEGFRVPAGQAYVPIESPKGELACHVVSDGGTRPYRAHLRDPSFHHMQAVSVLCEGGNLADVIPAIASIDPVIGGVDR